jgi:winged helix DNA-binding protein
VARSLVAIHGTDPATVFLSVAARTEKPTVADIESALYVHKALIRLLGMRRTMFVVPDELAPVVQAACTRAIAVRLRRTTLQLYAAAGIAEDLDTWLHDLEDATALALSKRGEATAQELTIDVPDLKRQVLMAAGKNYEGLQGVAPRVLMQLSAEGRIMRGRPRGSWISTQYRWAPIDAWLPGGLTEWDTGLAQAELIRRWLQAFGPGTLVDLKWWTGLSMSEVKRALAQLDVAEVDLDGGTGVVLADDLEPVAEPLIKPWVALLPALDSTPMGFSERGWFLGNHAPKIFDRSGNIGPTVWCDGRIVGGWAQRQNGTVAYKLLEDVGSSGPC